MIAPDNFGDFGYDSVLNASWKEIHSAIQICKNDADGTIRHCVRLGLVPLETYTGERDIEIKKKSRLVFRQ